MKTITTTTNVYPFSELSEKVKEVVRERFIINNAWDDYALENVVDDFASIALLLGITLSETNGKPSVLYSCTYSQGDGACFEGTWKASDLDLAAIKAYAPIDTELQQIARDLAQIAEEHPGMRVKVTHDGGRYVHGGSVYFEYSYYDEQGVELPDDESLASVQMVAFTNARENLRDLMGWLYSKLLAEQEYQNSDEVVDGQLIDSDFFYTEAGKRRDS